ncbi:hypothetical protein MKX01_010610 [Papaver californicum]|nr:hypothetical protein MKX01_010610 [Papaver californicum]
MFLQFLLLLLLSRLTLLTSSSTTVLPQAKPGCQANCGDFAVTYPFGIGPNENGCSLIGDDLSFYNVTCDTSYHPPKPFLWLGTNLTTGNPHMIELTSIAESELRVRIAPSTICYQNETGNVPALDNPLSYMYMLSTPFTISSTKNTFFGLGCNSLAYLYAPKKNFTGVCSTKCETKEKIVDGSCSGSGCCQIPVPKGMKWFISRTNQTSKINISFSPCSYSFISETDKYTFKASDLDGASFRTKGSDVSVVLDWAIGNKTCEEARKDLSTFACQKNSNCRNSDKTPGYLCSCSTGFAGNPYLSPGCQDVNECEDQDNNPCVGTCTNTLGSYSCTCPDDSHGDGRKRGTGCTHRNKDFPVVKVTLGIGFGFLFLIVATTIYLNMKRRKLSDLKKKKFQQNGGLLLKQKISSYEGGVEATKIFTAKELELATKNYSDKLILGRGGFGTVYKGTLPDERIVAIKKSKIVDETQIEQFINEIVILTQVNHRNVVKVLGCCLEAEVPLLVYEYVSNGTLFKHIHNKEDEEQFLSWQVRLRIATESAGALAYLHSAASVPIIHRDIKSANILLDDNFTAKIADFGASRLNSLDQTQIDTLVKGTLGYLDPEYVTTNLLTNKSDVYSFGVVLLELLTGEKPISFAKPQEQRSLVSCFMYAMERNDLFKVIEPKIANEEKREQVIALAELALRCLNLKGGERPTMKEVATELERLSKIETCDSSEVHNQHYDFIDEQTYLDSTPISSYTSGESGQCSTDKDLLTPINMLW